MEKAKQAQSTHAVVMPRSVSSWMQCAGTDGKDFLQQPHGRLLLAVNGVCWMKNVCFDPALQYLVTHFLSEFSDTFLNSSSLVKGL